MSVNIKVTGGLNTKEPDSAEMEKEQAVRVAACSSSRPLTFLLQREQIRLPDSTPKFIRLGARESNALTLPCRPLAK